MFQDFATSADKTAGPGRLSQLRGEIKRVGATHFLVPHADEHQNEYLPARAERLAWLTGFTGSAGFCVAGLEDCTLFVDGRYTLQAREQVVGPTFTVESLIDNPPSRWLADNTNTDDIIAFDPWLITSGQIKAYEKALAKSGASLKPVDNLIDCIWKDQPEPPLEPVTLHPIEVSGKEASAKIVEIQKVIAEKSVDLTVLTDPASLAWLFNIRGSDVQHNPLPLGFAIISGDGRPLLFIDGHKLDNDTRKYLDGLANLHEPEELSSKLGEITNEKTVLVDEARMPVALVNSITNGGGKLVKGRDPVTLPRAIKNETELSGAIDAQLRDGVAITKFLYWLDQQNPVDVTEIGAVRKLEEVRRANAKAMGSELKEISFDTISGFGPNGAIVHYRVTNESDLQFSDDALYLCDSGGQYADGTTDITRTVAIGTPPDRAIVDFTLVLKGHIAVATALFPAGTRGVDLDPFARHALWQNGKDFAHGTGHGIGSYLNVHEGPQSISKRGMEPLVPGMILSNEPGFYVEGAYGIRIENLVIVEEAKQVAGGNIETHSLKTITLAPIDRRLIDKALLSPNERDWLNTYHAQVRTALSQHLETEERSWLEAMTAEI
ncbi:MAG: aminopeptidase P family protein [Pseudomonadota bacterium]